MVLDIASQVDGLAFVDSKVEMFSFVGGFAGAAGAEEGELFPRRDAGAFCRNDRTEADMTIVKGDRLTGEFGTNDD